MIIGIDGNEANVKQRVGSNVYAFQLLGQLKTQISRLRSRGFTSAYSAAFASGGYGGQAKIKIYLKDKPLNDLPKESDWWQYKVLKPKYWWTQWRLPLELYFSNERPDLFFTPGHYAPRFSPCPTIISIMDLAFLRFPEQFKKRDLWQLVNWTKYSVKNAKHIFTISEFTKKEIVHFYNYPAKKITITYPGISQNSKLIRQLADQNHNLKLKTFKDKYFLYIGTLQPRKNLIRLIEAFKRVKKVKMDEKGEEIKLVLAGKKGWLYEEIFQKVKELELENSVIFTGFVTEKEKTALLKNALSFVYPSLYEGFGIPVLEAISVGCPVVVSKNSSLPEVAGKAAIYINNPYKVDSIQNSLLKMLELNEKERNEMIKEGYKKGKEFTWEKCTQKTMEVLCSLLKTKPGKN